MSAPEKNNKKGFRLEHWHFISFALALFDAIAVNAAHYIALWLRYDCHFLDIPYFYIDILTVTAPIYAIVCLVVFWRSKMYKTIWRFAGMHELYLSIVATLVTLIFQIGISIAVSHYLGSSVLITEVAMPEKAIDLVLFFFILTAPD